MSTTHNAREIANEYIQNVSPEALLHEIMITINRTDGRPQAIRVSARDCRSVISRALLQNEVSFITVGGSRNHVTVHKTGVSSVIFYDCFFLPPEERDIEIEKQAYDYVCAEYLPIADVYAEIYDEYIRHVNLGSFKVAFDRRSSTHAGSENEFQ